MTSQNRFQRPARGLTWAIALVIAASTTSLGCTTDPYTGEPQISRTVLGGLLGAGIGAGVGALTGDNGRERKKRALIGAGVGALAGGAVGGYMDYQEAKLRERLASTGVGIQRIGDEIVLVMPGNVTFETNSSDLKPDFFDVLQSVGVVLIEYNRTVVEVAGHTDSTGADDYNLDLSGKRASTVASYLRSQGVENMRLLTLAFGEKAPVASNETPSGREQNRRVEITLLPITES
jgi:outer membrane protein OmpA-like peptidoglycan-associated protein